MKKLLLVLAVLSYIGVLTGCVSDNLNAPCKNFGKSCQKSPVNSWDYNR